MNPQSTPRPYLAANGSSRDQTTNALGQLSYSALHGNLGGRPGTQTIPFTTFKERDICAGSVTNQFESITFSCQCGRVSSEEVRPASNHHVQQKGHIEPVFPAHPSPSSLHSQLPHSHEVTRTPHRASTVPPGLREPLPKIQLETKSADMSIQVALLEQELRLCQIQLADVSRANVQLKGLQKIEADRVYELVQELARCEQRTAKAEIAVDYLAELNMQVSMKAKELDKPDQRTQTLEKELQNAKNDAEMRISVLEMERKTLSQDNEKLRLKLEHTTDTMLGLFSLQRSATLVKNSIITDYKSSTRGTKDQHNNLIDLMDDCLTPTRSYETEEQTATLLNDSYDFEEDFPKSMAESPLALSDSFDSDFSQSSYIVRFKGIRDMTKHGQIMDTPIISLTDEAKILHDTHEERSNGFSSPRRANDVDRKSEQSSMGGGIISASASCNGALKGLPPINQAPTQDESFKKCVISSDKSCPREEHGILRDSKYVREILEDTAAELLHETPVASPNGLVLTEKQNKKASEPVFSKYELLFLPAPGETNAYRTLLISNLSPDITLRELLDQVRGGVILDAQLLNTTSITGNHSALLTFLYEHSALAYMDYVRKHPIMLHGLTAEISGLSPTWPVRLERRQEIFDKHQTRCLEIHGFPSRVSPLMLKGDLRTCSSMKTNRIVYSKLIKPGLVQLHFSSIDHACHAFSILSKSKVYDKCKPCFIHDPCAGPLEALEVFDKIRSLAKGPVPEAASVNGVKALHPADVMKQTFSQLALQKVVGQNEDEGRLSQEALEDSETGKEGS